MAILRKTVGAVGPSQCARARRGARCVLPLFLVLLFVAPAMKAEYDEYQVKAAFLYKFADFVEWPARAFENAETPLKIGVLGDDPFGARLDDAVKDKKSQNRAIVVQRSNEAAALTGCHIVFVGALEKADEEAVMKTFADIPALTVGESDAFAAQGGIIRFVKVDSKVGFEINLDAAKRVGLKLSSQLLKLAKAVHTGGAK